MKTVDQQAANTALPAAGPTLVVGLGNPGRAYRDNRHNVGFMVLDRLAGRLATAFTRVESKALVAKADFQGQRLVLAKPQTYMNLSGAAVSSLARFYKIELNQILIVYDDVDLPLGALRMRPNGGSAGQKGMASILERFGRQDIPRLRVGIGHPPGRMEAAAYVLHDFGRDELEIVSTTLDQAVEAILTFTTAGLTAAMNQYNG